MLLRLPKIVAALVAVFFVIQLVPYRVKNHPVVSQPKWDSPQTQQLFAAACADCHSNQTRPHIYEKVAPISWWITNHVDEGRAALNVSQCGRGEDGLGDAAQTVTEKSMPPRYYTWFGRHRDARLSAAERQQLATGLEATARNGCTK